MQLVQRDVKDNVGTVPIKFETSEALSVQLSQMVVLQLELLHFQTFKDSWRQCLQLVQRDVKDNVATTPIKFETSEALSMQLSQMVVLQLELLHSETFKDSWRQCLQLVSGHIQDVVVIQRETSETLSMQLRQMVVLQLELLHIETFEDSSWKRGKVIVLKVQLPHPSETFKDSWRQCLQLVSGHIQDAVGIQRETSETLRMQLSQIVALHVQLLHFETFKDSSWKCGQAVAFQVQFSE